MARNNNFVVITTGSHATSDFWPFSRKNMPKPFLDLLGTGKSLLQLTYERCLALCDEDRIMVATTEPYIDLVKEQLPQLSEQQILIEPINRGAAVCVAYAAYKIRQLDPSTVITMMPADHAIFGEIAFLRDIGKALETAASDPKKLLIIGIKPSKPETRYRYIQYHYNSGGAIKKIKTLTDKPQIELANLLVNSGDFVWNTDIYVWHVNAIIEAVETYLPEVAEVFSGGLLQYGTDQEPLFLKNAYSQCKNTTLSYGILEKTDNHYVLLGNFNWSAIDSWQALFSLKKLGNEENTIEANAVSIQSKSCFIKSTDGKLIIVHSLHDYLVADSSDVLLICPKSEVEQLKQIMKEAEEQKGEDYI
ncbi:MAG: sugar phosphate nucleotidyltransferase [Tunicatimonas sp.]|uniref:mannose-1-phosphate guanylyltransferase n=1 Tax=Tunicatimonas sp. TaxID=1940096 RepID=UPI003C77B612